MKTQKHSVVIGRPGSARSNWNPGPGKIANPKRKHTWSSTLKMPFAVVNLNSWLKNYES